MSKKQLTEPHAFDEGKRVSNRMGFGRRHANPWVDGGEAWQDLYNHCIQTAASIAMDPKALEECLTIGLTSDELMTFSRILTELFDGVLKRDFNKMIERSGALEQHVSNCVAQHLAIDSINSGEMAEGA